ncbi:splicing factor U2af large subunit B [Artemisia annua]|uniref:Splicing factor U2af large subunit B n=1 Tax=Artemisia annua TaxID=35608 RepID=A0A2U1P327_ARTAN|nr:splicing factor U2af large subunit B [Artemisia annua]
MLQPGPIGPPPTKVLSLTQVVTEEELVNDEDYEDILEDMKLECGKFGEPFAIKNLPLKFRQKHSLAPLSSIFNTYLQSCNLVNVVIPRPNPNGEPVAGVGKVFLEYDDTEGSTRARQGLNGRKFGGNQVVASFYPEDKFSEGVKKVSGFDMAPSIMAGGAATATTTVTSGAVPEIQTTKRASRVTFADVSPTANEQVFSCSKKVSGFDMAPSIMASGAATTVTSGAVPEIQTTKRASRVTFADVSPTPDEQSGSHAYARESLKSILKNSPRGGYKDQDREKVRGRDFDRTRDTDRDGHTVRYTERCLRRKRGRDTDNDSDDDSYQRSRSHSRERYEHRSRSKSRSPSKRKRVSGFDIAPPASAILSGGGAAVTAPTVPGMFQDMPVQLTQQATRHARRVYVGGLSSTVNEQSVATFFSHVMSAIGGNTAGPGDAVVNVYINHEKKFAFVEMRSVEEASNAIALDGIMFEGAPVNVRRPSDYKKSLAATLGPSEPNSNLNLAAVGLKPGSAGGIEGPDRIFVAGIPYSLIEAQIRELLETFGALRRFDLVKDKETGNSKGYAFCVFQDLSVTDIACAALNGFKIGNKILTVKRANEGQTQPKPELESILLHAQQQIGLQKMMLQSGAINTSPTRVLSLTQAVTEKELVNDEDYEEILEDMKTECGKFGTLVNVIIPRPNPNGDPVSGVGKVFLEYADTESSTKARARLCGRKFDGNQVVVSFYEENKFRQGDYDG